MHFSAFTKISVNSSCSWWPKSLDFAYRQQDRPASPRNAIMFQRFTSVLFGDSLEGSRCSEDPDLNEKEEDDEWILVDYLGETSFWYLFPYRSLKWMDFMSRIENLYSVTDVACLFRIKLVLFIELIRVVDALINMMHVHLKACIHIHPLPILYLCVNISGAVKSGWPSSSFGDRHSRLWARRLLACQTKVFAMRSCVKIGQIKLPLHE